MFNELFIICLIIVNICICKHIIEVPLEKTNNKVRIYNFYFENYSNPISLSLSHRFSYFDYAYFTQKYKSISQHPLIIKQNPYLNDFFLYKDKLTFKGTKHSFNFLFYAKNTSDINEHDKDFVDFLTFRYYFVHNNESLIYLLYEQKIIPKKIFVLYLKENKLFLGGIPSNHKIHFKGKQILSLQDMNLHGWHLHFTSIKMGKIFHNFTYVDYKTVLIISGTSISVPSDFFDKIKSEYFVNYFDNNDCYRDDVEMWGNKNDVDFSEWGIRIWCRKSVIHMFPEVTFGFDGFEIVLTKDNLFKCDNKVSYEYCVFELADRKDNGIFLFGSAFIQEYYVKFDYEEKSLIFYLFEKVDDIGIYYVILFVNIIELFIGVVWIIYIKIINRIV